MFGDALLNYLSRATDGVSFEKAGSINEAFHSLCRNDDTDLILLDINLPDAQGVEGLVLLRKKFPLIPIGIISGNEEGSLVQSCYAHGASCFIKKTYKIDKIVGIIADKLYNDIDYFPSEVELSDDNQRETKADKYADITSAEMRVVIQICQGKNNKEIAKELNLSLPTIKAHTSNIMRKIGVKSRGQIILELGQKGRD